MPVFDNQSTKRIAAVVQAVEATGIDNLPPIQKDRTGSDLVWFLLIEDFDDDDNAQGSPGNWAASGDSGDGELTADLVARYTVRDTTGSCGATEGSWVCCRPLGTDNGSVWEPVSVLSRNYDRCRCILAETLAGTGLHTVDNVTTISGTSPLSDPDSTSESLDVYNIMDWDGDNNGIAFIEWDETNEWWHFYQVECPA